MQQGVYVASDAAGRQSVAEIAVLGGGLVWRVSYRVS